MSRQIKLLLAYVIIYTVGVALYAELPSFITHPMATTDALLLAFFCVWASEGRK